MKRTIGIMVLGLFTVACAQADLRPPDTRYIPLEHKIETTKDFPALRFFLVRGQGEVTPAKLDPMNPIVIPGNAAVGRGPALKPGEVRVRPYRGTTLVAVPTNADKAFPNEQAFHTAIFEKKVSGVFESKVLSEYEAVKINDPRKAATKRYRIDTFDAKQGIVLIEMNAEPQPEEEQTAASSGSRWMAMGLALAAVAGIAGLFFARRRGHAP